MFSGFLSEKKAATVFETTLSLKEIAGEIAGDLGAAARPPAVPRLSQELRHNHEILEKTKIFNHEAGEIHAI